MKPLELLINGARGRMGQTLVALVAEDLELHVCGAVDIGDDFAGALSGADAVVDFSHHSTIDAVLPCCGFAFEVCQVNLPVERFHFAKPFWASSVKRAPQDVVDSCRTSGPVAPAGRVHVRVYAPSGSGLE